jgi:ABC-type glutathione transport system ATPase component
MRTLAALASGVSKNVYLISHDPSVTAQAEEKVLFLPTGDATWHSPFTDILLGQLISAKMPEELGRWRLPVVADIYARMKTKVAPKG